MKWIVLFLMVCRPCFAEPPKGNQLEFDESVVEGLGGTFSGVTAVREKKEGSSVVSKQVDFKEKIKDSLRELPYEAAKEGAGVK